MRAWVVHQPGPVATGPLRQIERPVPDPGPGQLLLRIRCCGVCRTDLHLAEGDLPPKRPDTTPGHEVVAEVVAAGPGTRRFAVKVTTTPYRFDQADQALSDLTGERVNGAAVLSMA